MSEGPSRGWRPRKVVGPRKVVVASEPSASDPNHDALKENRSILDVFRSFDVVELPMPLPISSKDGRLPASYLNFYIGNSCVLVPTFGGESDKKAIRTLEGLFPRREVVGVDCKALVYGLGTIHCVTQQVPAAK